MVQSMAVRQWAKAAALVALVVSPAWVAAQAKPEPFNVKEHYTKYEHYIPMRDGKKLFTSIYVPKDTSHSYPFLMQRTPYSVAPYGVDQYRTRLGPTEAFEKSGYIFVLQDVRGRYLSEGTFVEMRPHIDQPQSSADVDESTDTYDTVDWLLKHVPNHNGRAGIWGISYPGFFTSASIIDSHPALKAASPEAPMTDLFMGDDAYHGGAFMLAANFGFYNFFKPRAEPGLPPRTREPFDWGTADAYDFFLKMGPLANADKLYFKGKNALWNDQVNHSTYDSYWQARDLSRHMKNIKCAVLVVGGWFDAEDLAGPFRTYHAVKKNNPGIFDGLVIGPWSHGGWARFEGQRFGRITFDARTGDYYREHIIFPFFEQHLKGKLDARLQEATVFETGTNVWCRYTAWPPAGAQQRTLYFHAGGKLSFDPPGESAEAFDEYTSDPRKPVPYIGYAATGVPQEYMVSDQRFAAKRPDVLVYETAPLETDLTVTGPVCPRLHVSTSGTDSDFVVKLIDVYPADYQPSQPDSPQQRQQRKDVSLPEETLNDYQQLVRGEPFRGKFRNSFEHPEPFTPGQVTALSFEMPDVNHTFRRGHRIMVQVQSSWFPLVDLNPQTFVNIPEARPADFQKATQRIYRSKSTPSGVVVPVCEKGVQTPYPTAGRN
jgi:putative CocE/NonD family hydrolase